MTGLSSIPGRKQMRHSVIDIAGVSWAISGGCTGCRLCGMPSGHVTIGFRTIQRLQSHGAPNFDLSFNPRATYEPRNIRFASEELCVLRHPRRPSFNNVGRGTCITRSHKLMLICSAIMIVPTDIRRLHNNVETFSTGIR